MSRELTAGNVKIYVEADDAAMGKRTADMVAGQLERAVAAGKKPVLWLLAAPSGFGFYRAFIGLCRSDRALRGLVKEAQFFQFDDYPVGREDPKFPITFRALLEEHFFTPLQQVCGELPGTHLMELTGGAEDGAVAAAYAQSLLRLLEDPGFFVAQVKGTGMDGHWGFHGAETPLEEAPKIIRIPMKGANIHQQRLDWPQYFRSDADVPRYAYSFTVSAFLKADFIIDNVPQPSKVFSVLAAYGNDKVLNEVPSSALKAHPNAVAVLTEKSAEVLCEYREALSRGGAKISASMHERLAAIWREPDNPAAERQNTRVMDDVLRKLGLL